MTYRVKHIQRGATHFGVVVKAAGGPVLIQGQPAQTQPAAMAFLAQELQILSGHAWTAALPLAATLERFPAEAV